MKITLVVVLMLFSSIPFLAQDTNITNYFPLAVGNIWIYYRDQPPYIGPGPGKEYVKVEEKAYFGDLEYYIVRTTVFSSDGSYYSTSANVLRIDTITGNIYDFNNGNICLVDSLNSKKNDSAFSTCESRWRKCTDTSSISYWGQEYVSKKLVWSNYFEVAHERTYLKGLGKAIIHSWVPSCSIHWGLIGCVINGVVYGDTTLMELHQIFSEIPTYYKLSQNYPNPFNPSTHIKFQIPKSEFVKLIIFDVLGKEIQTLVNQQLSPGTYSADFDGSSLPSGVYYYRIETQNFSETKKTVLIK